LLEECLTCNDMEAIFVGRMFKEMRKTLHKSDWLDGGFAEKIFEDMLYDKYSKQVADSKICCMINILNKLLKKVI